MQSFYFIRHAQTEANAAQIMCGGGIDTPLTKSGIMQAHKARHTLHIHHYKIPIQTFIHSDMSRTRHTAQILNESLNIKIIKDTNIKEHVVGAWEGVPWLDIADDYIQMKDPPEGETFKSFQSRIHTQFNYYLKEFQTPLFIAHGGVWRCFIASYGVIPTMHPPNAQLYYFEYDKHNLNFPWSIYHCLDNGDKVKQAL